MPALKKLRNLLKLKKGMPTLYKGKIITYNWWNKCLVKRGKDQYQLSDEEWLDGEAIFELDFSRKLFDMNKMRSENSSIFEV